MDNPSSMTPDFVRVLDVNKDTKDVFTLTLDTDDFQFIPGQFNMLYAFGAGESAISISGQKEGKVVHTIRNVGSVTGKLSELHEGDEVGVRGPFGRAWPMPTGKDVVLVAGGIGLAPLRPTIRHIFNNRYEFGEVHLVYGARNPEDLLYIDELERWKESINVIVTVDTCDASWRGQVGVVVPFVEKLNLDPEKTVVMTCGPEVMMRFTVQALKQKNIADEQIFVSMERNMKCAVGHCGHCQLGPHFICKDGPVFTLTQLKRFWTVRQM